MGAIMRLIMGLYIVRGMFVATRLCILRYDLYRQKVQNYEGIELSLTQGV